MLILLFLLFFFLLSYQALHLLFEMELAEFKDMLANVTCCVFFLASSEAKTDSAASSRTERREDLS